MKTPVLLRQKRTARKLSRVRRRIAAHASPSLPPIPRAALYRACVPILADFIQHSIARGELVVMDGHIRCPSANVKPESENIFP